MRYQQGIWTEGPGVQPTYWQDPKLPPMRSTRYTPPSTGASRDYGHTPRYVDTTHGRWTQGDKFLSQQKVSSYLKKSRAQKRAKAARENPPIPTNMFFKPGQALPAEYNAQWFEQSNEPLTPPTAGQVGSPVPEMPPTVARTAPAPALEEAQQMWTGTAPKEEKAPLTNPSLTAEQQRRRRMAGGL